MYTPCCAMLRPLLAQPRTRTAAFVPPRKDAVEPAGSSCYFVAMPELVLTTFDWVPACPRGYVRDLRVRWALEEAQLPYRVESVPFRERQASHFAHQPFGQVPWLT